MFTIVSVPKPFKGHIGLIQKNAIKSWMQLKSKPEIILIGDEEGVAEISTELHLVHVPNVERNEYGTPLYNSIFDKATNAASFDLLCHVAADAILFNDFVDAIEVICERFTQFLVLVKKSDCEINESINFLDNWEKQIKSYYYKHGKIYDGSGSDIFVFPKTIFTEIPPFSIGRAVFDNWLIYHAITTNIPTVVINTFVSLHQNHDYSHHIDGKKGVYRGEEFNRNLDLAGGYSCLFTIRDCKYELTEEGLRERHDPAYSIYRWIISYSQINWLIIDAVKLLRVVRGLFMRLKRVVVRKY